MEFLYFLTKCVVIVIISKFLLDTIKIYIKCKFKIKENNEIEE